MLELRKGAALNVFFFNIKWFKTHICVYIMILMTGHRVNAFYEYVIYFRLSEAQLFRIYHKCMHIFLALVGVLSYFKHTQSKP